MSKSGRRKAEHANNLDSGIMWLGIVGFFTILTAWFGWESADSITNPEVKSLVKIFYSGQAVVGIIYFGLAWFASKAPLFSTVSALVLFLGLQLFLGIISLELVASGIIIKALILIALVKAVQGAYALRNG